MWRRGVDVATLHMVGLKRVAPNCIEGRYGALKQRISAHPPDAKVWGLRRYIKGWSR